MLKTKAERLREVEAKILADSHLVMKPPRIRPFDEPELLPEVNNFTMSSGIARTPKGKFWVSWFGGEDGQRAYLLMASSDDCGKTWTAPRLIIKEPKTPNGLHRSILGANLWTDPQGRLWCFFTYYIGYFDGRGGVWASICENPDDEETSWSIPTRLCDGFVLNKPIIMSNGEWLLPTSLWDRYQMGLEPEDLNGSILYKELDHLRMANFLVSNDNGASWGRRGGVYANDRRFDEPSFIEKKSGELLCLLRTKYGFAESSSFDFGLNWTSPCPSEVAHCSARIFTLKLASGRQLMIKHGPLDKHIWRLELTAYLSEDDGETWFASLLLDERENISYPDGFQAPDGRIYVAYDYKRIDGEISLFSITEEDIIAGKIVSNGSFRSIRSSRAKPSQRLNSSSIAAWLALRGQRQSQGPAAILFACYNLHCKL